MNAAHLNVLVTDGNNRAALAIARSLGRRGHRITVGEKRQPSLAQVSRFCARHFTYPDPAKDGAGFLDRVLLEVRRARIDVILPVAEITTALVVEHRDAFETHCRVPFPDASVFGRAADKAEVLARAAKLGIPIPTGLVLAKPGERWSWPDGLRFPIVVKAHRSRVIMNGSWRSTSAAYARDEGELEAILSAKHPCEYPLLLQERIVGPGMGVFMCYDRGEPVAVFSHRRLREKPPSGGVSVLCESVPVSPELYAHGKALLDDLAWRGLAMVEFKLDQRDQTPKLMEINGRFWGSLQLAIDAGVDFPAILLQTLAGDGVRRMADYRVGVKSRWLLGDVDSLISRLVKSQRDLHLPDGHPGRIRTLIDFLSLWGRDLHYDVFSFRDARPGLHEMIQWIRRRD